MTELLALGISHKTAPVALRERLALGDRERRALLADLVAGDDVARGGRMSTCNRTEVYVVGRRPGRRRRPTCSARWRDARASARPSWPTSIVLAAQLRRGPPALPGRGRPGVDDRRRGRGAGPGQARLRGRARRGHDRAAAPTALPRRPADGQARAHRDRARREPDVSVSTVAVDLAREAVGDLRRPRGRHHRRRRDERADRQRAGRRRASRRCSSPTAAPTARSRWPQRFGGAVAVARRAARRCSSAPTSSCASTASPHAIIGAEELERRHGRRATARPLRAHRHRGAPRHRARLRRPAGVHLYDMDDLQGVVAAQPRGARRASARAPRRSSRRRSSASPRWLGQLDVAADGRGAARARRRRSSSRSLAENAGRWETASPSATWRASRRWPAPSCSACCTSRPSA